jgi:hypothetical protein
MNGQGINGGGKGGGLWRRVNTEGGCYRGDGGICRGRVKRVEAARVGEEMEDGLGGSRVVEQEGDGA